MCIHHQIYETEVLYENNKYIKNNYTIHSDIMPSVLLTIGYGTQIVTNISLIK